MPLSGCVVCLVSCCERHSVIVIHNQRHTQRAAIDLLWIHHYLCKPLDSVRRMTLRCMHYELAYKQNNSISDRISNSQIQPHQTGHVNAHTHRHTDTRTPTHARRDKFQIDLRVVISPYVIFPLGN